MVVITVIAAFSLVAYAAELKLKPQTLKLSQFAPPQHYGPKILFPFLKESIEKATDGIIKVQIYPPQALAKAPEHFDALASGRADIALVTPGFTPGYFRLTTIGELPFAWGSALEGNLVMNDLLSRGLLDKKLYTVAKVIMWAPTSDMVIWTKKPVSSVAGLRGLKLRVAGGSATSAVKAIGAVPIQMPLGDAYSALETGVIDGALFTFDAGVVWKVGEVCKFVLDVGITRAIIGVLMNKKVWDSLPQETQKKFELIFRDTSILFTSAEVRSNRIMRGKLPGLGVKITALPPPEMVKMRKLLQPVSDNWPIDHDKKGLPGTKVYKEFQETRRILGIR